MMSREVSMGRGISLTLRISVAALLVMGSLSFAETIDQPSRSDDVSGPVTLTPLVDSISLLRPAYRVPDVAACSLKNHYPTAMAYFSGSQAGTRWASYLNPENCSGSPDVPMSIYFVSLPLYHFSGANWPVGVELQIWEKAGADSCDGPGVKLYSKHFLLDSADFAMKVGVITLPDPVCVSAPFYVALEYDGTTPAPYPSVLFDTANAPDSCLNWGYFGQWVEWYDLWQSPVAGNFMVWVDGFSSSNYCATDESTIFTIESLHDKYDSLVGNRVSVVGYYTDSSDAKMVSSYDDYQVNEPLPTMSELLLLGPLPHDSFAGALVMTTGYLQAEPDPLSPYPDDSVTLYLYGINWTTVLTAAPNPGPSMPTDSRLEESVVPSVDCDSCKFAILISGGVNDASNHARYWNELAMMYKWKVEKGGYCPQNIFVHYYKGVSKNTGQIPQARVDSCTPGKIQASHAEISRRIAACTRAGKASTLEKFVSNHGKPGGISTLAGTPPIDGGTFRSWQQMAIDSCCQTLYDEFTNCYAGNVADSLKKLNDQLKTTIRVNSAGGNVRTYSTPESCPYIKEKIDSLNAGVDYDKAVAAATERYRKYLDSLAKATEVQLQKGRDWLAAHPPGSVNDSLRNKVVKDTLKLRQKKDDILNGLGTDKGRTNAWVRLQMKKYCEWQKVVVPPGGQLCLEFTGPASNCGNVTVYKDTLDGTTPTKKKVAVWNWNIPGSAGFVVGNDKRCINGDSTKETTFWIHNDNGEFAVTASLLATRPNAQSPSNVQNFAGFSVGGNDSSNGEFANIVAPGATMANVEQPGFGLQNVPANWGICGTAQLAATHNVPFLTPWHADMEFRVTVTQVLNPGPLNIQISGVENPNAVFNITTPGTYIHDCGEFFATGPQQIMIDANGGGCFAIDAWALRSTTLDPASCCVGTTGNVDGSGIINLADLSMLVLYLTTPGVTLPCYDEANVDAAGIINLVDLSALISYLTGGGFVLPNCP